MAGDKKRHQSHLRKTKAQLVDELEGLQRDLGELKRSRKPLEEGGSSLFLENPALIHSEMPVMCEKVLTIYFHFSNSVS